MNLLDRASIARELARALTTALEPALAPQATQAEVHAARDAAKILGLKSLDRLLNALLPHATRPWDAQLGPILDRLREIAARCAAVGSLEVIHGAESDLDRLALEVESFARDRASEELVGGEDAIPTLSLAEVLEDLPIADDASRERARRIRMIAPVAAALRAALDWLEEEGASPRPLRLTAEESVLEVICTQVNYAGLKPAGKVLAAVGGISVPAAATGSAAHPAGAWMVRVPVFAGRNSYLMLNQGGLKLAVPWHSVLRLYMVPAAQIEGGMSGLGVPLLEPFSLLSKSHAEYPVVLVGQGLKRGYLIADRLVWRLEAEPCDPEEPSPVPALARTVRTEDGEVYWRVDPGVLLAKVESPPEVHAARPKAAVEPSLPVLNAEDVEPLSAPELVESTVHGPSAPPRAGGTESPAAPKRARKARRRGSPSPARRTSQQPPPASGPPSEAGPPAPAHWPPSGLAPAAGPTALAEPPPVGLASAAGPSAPEKPPTGSTAAGPRASEPPVGVAGAPASAPSTPMVGVPAARGPAAPVISATPVAGRPGVMSGQPRALVAEDSITARIFLTRLLEREGFAVRAVSSAPELFDELVDESWSLICVDVDLPDGADKAVLGAVIERLKGRRSSTPAVALVRDAYDIAFARAVGATRTLSKPFDPAALQELLALLGFGPPKAR